MRLKSKFWVDAYLRRCENAGAFASVSRRGEISAGSIFIEVLRTGEGDLWGPAPLSEERSFEPLLRAVEPLAISERMASEVRFDPDLWLVTVEGASDALLEEEEHG